MKKILIIIAVLAMLTAVVSAQDEATPPSSQLGLDLCSLIDGIEAGELDEAHQYMVELIHDVNQASLPADAITYTMAEESNGVMHHFDWEWIEGESTTPTPILETAEGIDTLFLFVSYGIDNWVNIYTSTTYVAWFESSPGKAMYFWLPEEEYSPIYVVDPENRWVPVECPEILIEE